MRLIRQARGANADVIILRQRKEKQLLKYIYDHMSEGKMKDGEGEFSAALDKVVGYAPLKAEVFVHIGTHQASGLGLAHFAAVAKRTRNGASNARIKRAGWINVGKVFEYPNVIIERLKQKRPNPWSNCVYAFVREEWRGAFRSYCQFTQFDVTAPVQEWPLIASLQSDITDQAEHDWAALTADNGCVKFAHLQFLPLSKS